ncbi:type II toxin-antitoxin system VapC family toxin [Synechococcus sp. J7-Johnson]|uniref:type II toxin-antitoxin system VapC family toxin n=1 Tax=Synechococcus sp. J7-Johnson TaxID=2823737 RepID=UPI0020CF37BD|nr:type II toxin-antitoxin system VapC family toxin [Synechococcus sp. J7-Johnson]MCP9840668.1 type II toxin-antitoxin system VapC family toxin [Synechococcus sp. J7-Johnson]
MASAANGLLVIDTDVLIDYLRDQPLAVVFLEGCDQPLAVSVVSIAELYVGVREGEERQRLDAFVSAFSVLPLEKEAAIQAGLLRRQYGRSHGTGLADALIAASVQAAGATLATLNRRHFPMLATVLVPYAKEG